MLWFGFVFLSNDDTIPSYFTFVNTSLNYYDIASSPKHYILYIWHDIMYVTRHLTPTNVDFFLQRQGWETYLNAPVTKNVSFS